jgi:glutathione-specific gamma-glutamylcyclotransferase
MSFSMPARSTEEQLQASLAAALAHWDGQAPLWVFGYGSLIWRPEFDFETREPARVHGYHRRLCLRSVQYRGTHECPGIVAGLDRGGSCLGMAYRVGAAGVPQVFRQLWEREMFLGSYRPTWMQARLLAGGTAEALAFVVRRDAFNYCSELPEDELIDILLRACGVRGTSLEYLQRTVAALHEAGLRDPHLERLMHKAERRISAR